MSGKLSDLARTRTPCDTDAKEIARQDRLVEVKHNLEVIIAKQRNGPTGTVHLFCDIAATPFATMVADDRPCSQA